MEKRYFYLDDEIYFTKSKNETIDEFMKLFPCNPHSPFYSVIQGVYNDLYGAGINMYKDYIRYYRKEYSDFSDYLYEHHCLDRKQINNFNNEYSYCKHNHIFNSSTYQILNNTDSLKIIEEFIGGKIKNVY